MDSRSAYLWLYHKGTARWIFYILDPDVFIEPNDSERGTFRNDPRLPLENDPNFKKTFWDSVAGKYFTYE